MPSATTSGSVEFLNAGVGFGGGCLPKDIRALAVCAEELEAGVVAQLIEAIEAINSGQRAELAELTVEQLGGDVTCVRIAVLGATFKTRHRQHQELPPRSPSPISCILRAPR